MVKESAREWHPAAGTCVAGVLMGKGAGAT
jgi:hypothetical protein